VYSSSLLRKVRIEMPRMLAAWGAGAEAVLERLLDQVALDLGDGAPDQRPRHGLGGCAASAGGLLA
jgi:hypothetical protein